MSQPALRFDRESPPTRMGAAPEQTTVLVVDDSAFDRQVVGRLLEPMKDLRVVYACNGCDGFAAIDRELPAIILTDLIMPDMEGLDLVQQVRALHPHISVILMTAFGTRSPRRGGQLHREKGPRS
jgi:CheY-like chemotaxis protein